MDGLNQDAKLLEGHSSQLLKHLQFKQKGSPVKDNNSQNITLRTETRTTF